MRWKGIVVLASGILLGYLSSRAMAADEAPPPRPQRPNAAWDADRPGPAQPPDEGARRPPREGEDDRPPPPPRDGDDMRRPRPPRDRDGERRPPPPREDEDARPPRPREGDNDRPPPREGQGPRGGPNRQPPPGPPRWPHEDWASLEKNDPEMYKLLREDNDIERQTHEAAMRYRQAPPDQREAIKKEVEKAVARHFEVRQQRRALELKRLEGELQRLREAIELRNKNRSEIVEKRVSELLGRESPVGF